MYERCASWTTGHERTSSDVRCSIANGCHHGAWVRVRVRVRVRVTDRSSRRRTCLPASLHARTHAHTPASHAHAHVPSHGRCARLQLRDGEDACRSRDLRLQLRDGEDAVAPVAIVGIRCVVEQRRLKPLGTCQKRQARGMRWRRKADGGASSSPTLGGGDDDSGDDDDDASFARTPAPRQPQVT